MVLIPDKIATSFNLYINNPEKKKIGLRITHKFYGEVIDTLIETNQFSRRYNFEQVED